ncbi:MAG: uracil phosphoribosyltransferase [Eubacteriales bacterium]|jgi:uracil phosphoribosyltransferase|nr:uracil phosphoribosyltransferase [Clostridiales bacterium]MDO5585531.1 uracil phosphoribosyltransferase [Clostridia bacterium]MDY4212255.1 uracil phosphoribosyltransferase [Eubacteriales bacterium]MDY5229867.1 uracil phosphoribosyltransferase [Eubacteriales bacterium]
MNKQVHEMNHPLIMHKISILRNEATPVKEFRELVNEIALLMGYEATRDLDMVERPVKTPICETNGKFISKQVALVPVLRAGLGMVDALMSLIPAAKVGHIGLYRDPETHVPVEYYCKLPNDISERQAIVLDPMLATGGSAAAAIDFLKEHGAKRIKLMCIIAAPEGVEAVTKAHPDVEVFCGVIDEKLNENCYIVPGLGDAGDRLFGTL